MLIVILVAQGCTTTPEKRKIVDVEGAWDYRQALLKELTSWTMKGRLAVKVEDQGWQAGMRWRQQNDQFNMEFLGPLGRKVAWMNGGPSGVRLRTSEGKSSQASDPETLMHNMLGWSLPVSGMRYWVLGIPSPQSRAGQLQLDDVGRLSKLEQFGWEVNYLRYRNANVLDLPAKMTLINKRVSVKVVVSDWQTSVP